MMPQLMVTLILLSHQPTIMVEKYEPPLYPTMARHARVEAKVRLALVVEPDGAVSEARIVEGHPMFRTVSTDAIKKWRFACDGCEPAKPFRHEFEFTFRISNRQPAEREELRHRHSELKCSKKRRGKAKQECDEIDRRMSESCNSHATTAKLLANDRMEIELVAPCIQTINVR